jgi:hypothetical protein
MLNKDLQEVHQLELFHQVLQQLSMFYFLNSDANFIYSIALLELPLEYSIQPFNSFNLNSHLTTFIVFLASFNLFLRVIKDFNSFSAAMNYPTFEKPNALRKMKHCFRPMCFIPI